MISDAPKALLAVLGDLLGDKDGHFCRVADLCSPECIGVVKQCVVGERFRETWIDVEECCHLAIGLSLVEVALGAVHSGRAPELVDSWHSYPRAPRTGVLRI